MPATKTKSQIKPWFNTPGFFSDAHNHVPKFPSVWNYNDYKVQKKIIQFTADPEAAKFFSDWAKLTKKVAPNMIIEINNDKDFKTHLDLKKVVDDSTQLTLDAFNSLHCLDNVDATVVKLMNNMKTVIEMIELISDALKISIEVYKAKKEIKKIPKGVTFEVLCKEILAA